MPDYSYLETLTDAELDALKAQTEADIVICSGVVADAQQEKDDADQEAAAAEALYDAAKNGQNIPPTVDGETNINTGAVADVMEFIAVDIPINMVGYTGNGDDGLGIVTDWSIPLEVKFNSDTQIYVSGEKVDETAQILQTINGGIPSFGDSLLTNEVGVVIPDLFDASIGRNPDKTFVVTATAKPANQTYAVSVFAKPADQTFVVERGPAVPDQIFEIKSIEVEQVSVAEPPFIVSVFAEPADQIFDVRTSAVPADQTFSVTRGPDLPNQIFDVYSLTKYDVSVSYAVPDQVFIVELGAAPAPTPDQIFDVSIGGPDAPPIPQPDQTFAVTTGFAIPHQIFRTQVVTALDVFVQEKPFTVTVGPDVPQQIFDVTAAAKPFDQSFAVAVGPDVPDQIFEVKRIENLEVGVYETPKFYSVQENISPAYVVSGEGLTFAVEPTIGLYVGQKLHLSLDVPANALWIKDVQEDGAGVDASTFGATVTRNGAISGTLTAQFFQPGTYYYQSEFDAGVFGQIDVFGTQPNAPDQTFVVTTMATPADQVFAVTLGPDIPDFTHVVKTGEIFDVTVGPDIPSQTFEVKVFAEAPDQTFVVEAKEPVLEYLVTNSGSGDYLFTGEGLANDPDPALTAVVGQEMQFTLSASGHPFWIGDTNTTGAGASSAAWADVLVNNGIETGGTIRVVFNTAGTYHYNCQFHGSMHGTITVT